MNRRRFLSISTASLAVPLLPRSLAGFAEGAPVDAELLGVALKQARAAGRPLLCLVVPADPDDRWIRAHVLGSWLNHMDDAALLDLALTDLVCASTEAIEAHGFRIEKNPLPWMLLYPADGTPPMNVGGSLRIRTVLDGDPYLNMLNDEKTDDRIKLLSRSLNMELFRETDLAAHADNAWARVSAEDQARMDHWLKLPDGPSPDGTLLRRGAAQLRQRAADLPAQDRARVLQVLIDQVIETERAARPAGAKWANSDGCGTEIEGDERQSLIACGMGYTPPLSRRFLYFYLHEPRDPDAIRNEDGG